MKKGFTLVELLATIVVLAIVIAIAVPGVNYIIKEARIKSVDREAELIHNAVLKYTLGSKTMSLSHITKENIDDELNVVTSDFDFIGLSNENGKITVTLTKYGYTATASNNLSVLEPKVYGLKIDFSNPSNPYTRLDDAAALCQGVDPCAQPGTDSLTPVNKFDEADIYKDIKDKVVDGNYFVEIPKFYIKKVDNANTLELRISKKKHDNDYYLPNVFKNYDNNTEYDHVLIGKYSATLTDGKLGSKPGLMPRVSATINTMRNEARANGAGYQLIDIHAIDLIQTLFHIEFATLNSQSVMAGYTDYSNSSAIASGQTDAVNSSSGSITSNKTGKFAMKYRGIENIYGNVFQAVDGINIQNHRAYVSEKPNSYQSDKFDGDYKDLGYPNATSTDYPLRMGYDANKPYAQFPTSAGTMANSLYKDYYLQRSGNRVAFFGGSWLSSAHAGVSFWYLNYAGGSGHASWGSRILKTAS